MFSLSNCLVLAGIIFAAGAWGVLARRNVLVMLISVELMLNAVNLVFVSFARAQAHTGPQGLQPHAGAMGQLCALFVIAIAAAEAAVGLAIVIALFRNKQSVDTQEMRTLQH
ncbi:MAG: NADH-quinone oxidoreductase subunit NuoK [Planctomycetota bacterium]